MAKVRIKAAGDALTIGLAQVAPVWLNREKTLSKVTQQVEQAAARGLPTGCFRRGAGSRRRDRTSTHPVITPDRMSSNSPFVGIGSVRSFSKNRHSLYCRIMPPMLVGHHMPQSHGFGQQDGGPVVFLRLIARLKTGTTQMMQPRPHDPARQAFPAVVGIGVDPRDLVYLPVIPECETGRQRLFAFVHRKGAAPARSGSIY